MKALNEIGLFTSSGGQFVGHTFQELRAYQEAMGVAFDPWESNTLTMLSRTAAHWTNVSRRKDAPNPLGDTAEEMKAKIKRIDDLIFKK